MRARVVACVLILASTIRAQSQDGRVPVKPPTLIASPTAARGQTPAGPAPAAASLPSPDALVRAGTLARPQGIAGCAAQDAAVEADCLAALHENYRYVTAALQHRRASFDWSLLASKIMFFVVLALVLAGLVFAAIQFRSGGPTLTALEISTSGIKVSSPVVGVIVLVLSMAFFYMYARYVYPLQEVHRDASDVSQSGVQ